MKIYLTIAIVFITLSVGYAQDLIIIDQDYQKALSVAKQNNKLIFIDFYTTWCAPCKELDRLVFQSDDTKSLLAHNFILLKYDAEKDKTHNLSKKHHVSSYPTAIILNKDGYVINRKYGFPGADAETLTKNVLEFTDEGISLNNDDKILKGYSNKIDVTRYPEFYVDYLNRDNLKVTKSDNFRDYWLSDQDPLSEEYFSTLLYFGRHVPTFIADSSLNYKDEYLDTYGKTDTEILYYFLSSGKFSSAISNKNERQFNDATSYAKSVLSKKWTDDIIPMFELDFLKAQNKWDQVFKSYEDLNKKETLDGGQVNHFCWDVYKNCDDQIIIEKCMQWMKSIAAVEPKFDFLDTYAFLAYKSGNKKETQRIALLALDAAKKEGRKTKGIKELIEKVK